jgi:hypothetical protein
MDKSFQQDVFNCHNSHDKPVGRRSTKLRRDHLLAGFLLLCLLLFFPLRFLISPFYTPLPHPGPFTGTVLDDATGQPIPGIEIKATWALADYPMIDGASTYYIVVSATTDNNGHFLLPAPRHRTGYWSTDFKGLKYFDLDGPYVTYYNSYPDSDTVIRLKKMALAP